MNEARTATEVVSGFDWAQFGISGLVIAALFATQYFLIKMHRDERAEWREDNTALRTVIEELKDAIKELYRRLE